MNNDKINKSLNDHIGEGDAQLFTFLEKQKHKLTTYFFTSEYYSTLNIQKKAQKKG